MKSKFRDAEDREWTLYLDLGVAAEIRKQTGFSFGTCLGSDGMAAEFFDMLDDFELVGSIAWVMCQTAAKGRDISEQTFKAAVRGDVFDGLQVAMTEAFADFCPSRQRLMLENVLAASKRGEEELQLLQGQMETFLRNVSNTEESSESIPEPLASDS